MSARSPHLSWLTDLTQVPTAAGREQRVIEWIRRWVADRPDLTLTADPAGNLVVAPREPWAIGGPGGGPLFITAHLDHPAFVVERIVGPGTLELSFRGGVMDLFFEDAPIALHTAAGERLGATLSGPGGGLRGNIIKTYLAELDAASDAPALGDVATWALPPAEVKDGLLHTHACDDLAAAAAALAAMDVLREKTRLGEPCHQDIRLLFTRAEEIGFIGAIAACKHGTIPRDARILALENSRSFADSPIGGGPIVRVGDRMSIFTPWLTAACAKRAEDTFAVPWQSRSATTPGTAEAAGQSGSATPPSSQTAAQAAPAGRPWQRKLMAGGACEASVFCAYGYQATCLCLPLGNYHNMPHLGALQDGTYDRAAVGPPRAAREFISIDDFHGLVDLLVALGTGLPPADAALDRIEKLYTERSFVLDS